MNISSFIYSCSTNKNKVILLAEFTLIIHFQEISLPVSLSLTPYSLLLQTLMPSHTVFPGKHNN